MKPRSFPIHALNDSLKNLEQRAAVIRYTVDSEAGIYIIQNAMVGGGGEKMER